MNDFLFLSNSCTNPIDLLLRLLNKDMYFQLPECRLIPIERLKN